MPSKSKSAVSSLDLEVATKAVLNSIEREREQEIISRRFGLFDRKETLEQIGEFLGITRERVRQLEKVVVTKLKSSATNNNLQAIADVDKEILDILSRNGNVMRVSALAGLLSKNGDKIDQVANQLKDTDVTHIASLASTSKHLAQLNGQWGLTKWPTVNPRNIRDKIYVILKENQKHMHLSLIHI